MLHGTSLMVQWLGLPTPNMGDTGLIPGTGRSPGEGNANPLPYSCLENPRDRRAWWTTLHGVTKRWTRLKRLSTGKPSFCMLHAWPGPKMKSRCLIREPLVAWWLAFWVFTTIVQVQSLVRELRFHKLCGAAKIHNNIK